MTSGIGAGETSLPDGTGVRRHVHTEWPLNAGTPLDVLGRDFLTPAGLHFVRTHGTIPRLDPQAHRIEVAGLVERPLSLSARDLAESFPTRDVAVTLVCAGLRRAELAAFSPTRSSLHWGADAASTALWSGVRLADILAAAGVAPNATDAAFESADAVGQGADATPFGASIAIDKAVASETLVATRMNGEAIPIEHGGPVRLIVPGYVGARSVKWLARIAVQDSPSDNPFQRLDYRLARTPPGEMPDPGTGAALDVAFLTSAITEPAEGERLPAGPVEIRGYAIAWTGGAVRSVEVTADRGRTWHAAVLAGEGAWTWRQWTARLSLAPGRHDICVRAWDETGEGQPRDVAEVWNYAGYMNTSWHRVRVDVG